MKPSKILILVFILPLFAFTSLHKYYISVTYINYIEDEQSVQIISKIFVDDIENVLREFYDENINLEDAHESLSISLYLKNYLNKKLVIKINNQKVNFKFIGKEYEDDILRCYLEIENVKSIDTFEISNKILFDLFEDQQNIIKTNINTVRKSVIHTSQENNTTLKF